MEYKIVKKPEDVKVDSNGSLVITLTDDDIWAIYNARREANFTDDVVDFIESDPKILDQINRSDTSLDDFITDVSDDYRRNINRFNMGEDEALEEAIYSALSYL